MNYGVTIKKGAENWQIFQMDKAKSAKIYLEGEYERILLSQELPLSFSHIDSGAVTVKARVAREDSGENVVPWCKCELFGEKQWRIQLTLPAGGLYRIETYMEYDGWNGLSATRGDMVHNIGVGDIFVIAGQSNAAGRAKSPIIDAPELGIHVLRSSGEWQLATHPLGETTNAVHIGHFENHNPGHSPWLHFAKEIKKHINYPIGLVPCAYGGAPLRWWNPSENGSLFTNMLEMLDEYSIKPKAVLWYQGEAEGYENASDTYLQRFKQLVTATREKLGDSLPFITVQLNRCVSETSVELDHAWGMVRQAQVSAMHEISYVATVPSNDLSLYDFIHNSSEANLVIGERCAKAALQLCYNIESDWRAPEIESAEQISPNTIHVTYSRIRNWLNPFDVPAAALPINAQDEKGVLSVKEYKTGSNNLTLAFEREIEGEVVLHGAWRTNTGGLVPADCMRMPCLSFYGFKIKKAYSEEK